MINKELFAQQSFYVDISIYDNSCFMVRPGKEVLDKTKSNQGSFSVVCARLMGLSYPDYCRMCRDKLGATLFGKHGYYIGISFKDRDYASVLCDALKERWEYAKVFTKV